MFETVNSYLIINKKLTLFVPSDSMLFIKSLPGHPSEQQNISRTSFFRLLNIAKNHQLLDCPAMPTSGV